MQGYIKDFMYDQYGRVDISAVSAIDKDFVSLGVALKVPNLGTEGYQVGNTVYDVGVGSMLLLDEGVPFRAMFEEKTPQHGMCVDIPRGILEAAHSDWNEEACNLIPEVPSGLFTVQAYPLYQTLQTFHHQLPRFDWREEGYECVFTLAGYVRDFLGEIRREQQRIPVVKASTQAELYRRLHVALAYLHDTFRAPFVLADVAQHSFLSEFHLARLFKQVFGCTLFVYHERLKMTYAHDALTRRDVSVLDLAVELGYGDASYFIRRFKKRFGYTPGKLAR